MTTEASIEQYLERQRERVNRALEKLLPGRGHPEALYAAMNYSLRAGGKRLRPILTLAAAETIGERGEGVLKVACAVECIHTYSLIHDDLPAMDNSDLRRGLPTCHRAFGEAMAILAGDALLTFAFELLSSFGLEQGRERAALQITRELARAAGMEGMIGGQVLDLEGEGASLSLEELELMNRKKTGALLRAAVRCGAYAAGASPLELEALSDYGSALGWAFQIVDDLLDLEGTAAELGKPTGADQARAKATYPALMGVDAARAKVADLYRQALSHLDRLPRPTDTLRQIAQYLATRTS